MKSRSALPGRPSQGRSWRPVPDRQVPPTAPHKKGGQFGGKSDPNETPPPSSLLGGTSLVAGVRCSFRGKDAGSTGSRPLSVRPRTQHRGEQRGPAAQPYVSPSPPTRSAGTSTSPGGVRSSQGTVSAVSERAPSSGIRPHAGRASSTGCRRTPP